MLMGTLCIEIYKNTTYKDKFRLKKNNLKRGTYLHRTVFILKPSWYQFKQSYYKFRVSVVIPKKNSREIPKRYTQK